MVLGDFKAPENLVWEKAMAQAFGGGSRGLGSGGPLSHGTERWQQWWFSFVALLLPSAQSCRLRR